MWQHKKPALQIMQLTSDGPFARARSWYSQFFNPREKSPGILAPLTGTYHIPGVPPWSETVSAGAGAD